MSLSDKNFKFIEPFSQYTPASSMSKREFYAGLAMQGLLAGDTNYQRTPEQIARYSVDQADALIKELEKEKTDGQSN